MKTKEHNLAAAVKELDDTVLDANDELPNNVRSTERGE